MKRSIKISVVSLALVAGSAFAAPELVTFKAGDAVSASQMNNNFQLTNQSRELMGLTAQSQQNKIKDQFQVAATSADLEKDLKNIRQLHDSNFRTIYLLPGHDYRIGAVVPANVALTCPVNVGENAQPQLTVTNGNEFSLSANDQLSNVNLSFSTGAAVRINAGVVTISNAVLANSDATVRAGNFQLSPDAKLLIKNSTIDLQSISSANNDDINDDIIVLNSVVKSSQSLPHVKNMNNVVLSQK